MTTLDRTKQMFDVPGTGRETYTEHFSNADLVLGVLTVNHMLKQLYPVVVVYNNAANPVQVLPDFVYSINTNRIQVDLSSYGVIAGVWHVRVIGG